MKSAAYWSKRSALLMHDRMEGAEIVSAEISNLYYHAYNEVLYKMDKIYSKYKTKHGLTDKEALKLLNSMTDPADLDELKKALQNVGSEEAQEILAQLETPAYAARIKRLQDLQMDIDGINTQLYQQDVSREKRWYTNLATETYNQTIYDVQRQVGFQFSFKHIDTRLINRVMNSKWSGESFSQTLWKNVDGVSKEVQKQLTLGLITGKTEKQMAKEIANKYQVGAFESRRLVRTESCYLSNEIQMESYKECGADKYMYIATLDSKTDEACGHLDRKIFDVKDKTPGLNCPPMHPFCRCSTKIYIDQDTRDDMKRRARNPKTGKNEIVPANMSYDEWAEANGLKKKVVGTDKPISGVNPNTQNLEEMRKKIDAWVGKAEDAGAMTAETRKKFVDGIMANDDLRRMADKFGEPTNGYQATTGTSNYDKVEQVIHLNVKKGVGSAANTAAHEHGHWWDRCIDTSGLSFKEMDTIRDNLKYPSVPTHFANRASMSDEFLAAVRKDRDALKAKYKSDYEMKKRMFLNFNDVAVQDMLSGCGFKVTLYHTDAYYNRYYDAFVGDAGTSKRLYGKLGITTKAPKQEFRIYDMASELWANITETEFIGGAELEYMKECLPESYAVWKKIVGGV